MPNMLCPLKRQQDILPKNNTLPAGRDWLVVKLNNIRLGGRWCKDTGERGEGVVLVDGTDSLLVLSKF